MSAGADTVIIEADDGRALAFCQWGEPAGRPVWFLHGSPGCRLLRPADVDFAGLGVRLLTYDRPGYGRSDRRLGRSVADTASDVAAISDYLSLHEFAVVGVSGGGPHALAVAAVQTGRVTRCATINGLGPPDAVDLDFFGGMDSAEVAEWRALTEPDRDVAGILRGMHEWIHTLSVRRDMPVTVQDMLVTGFTEALTAGAGGLLDDYLALSSAWGFELSDVRCATTVLAAEEDRNVPPAHGRWLVDHLARAALVTVPGGHLDPRPAQIEQILVWAAGDPRRDHETTT